MEKWHNGYVVHLFGFSLPFSYKDITDFIGHECNILGGHKGIVFPCKWNSRQGRDAFVKLASEIDLLMALQKNKCSVGDRFIQVQKVDLEQMRATYSKNKYQFTGFGNEGSTAHSKIHCQVGGPVVDKEKGEHIRGASHTRNSLLYKFLRQNMMKFRLAYSDTLNEHTFYCRDCDQEIAKANDGERSHMLSAVHGANEKSSKHPWRIKFQELGDLLEYECPICELHMGMKPWFNHFFSTEHTQACVDKGQQLLSQFSNIPGPHWPEIQKEMLRTIKEKAEARKAMAMVPTATAFNPKMEANIMQVIRTGKIYCGICYMPVDEDKITTHLETNLHKLTLNIRRDRISNLIFLAGKKCDYNCEICRVQLQRIDWVPHVAGRKHIVECLDNKRHLLQSHFPHIPGPHWPALEPFMLANYQEKMRHEAAMQPKHETMQPPALSQRGSAAVRMHTPTHTQRDPRLNQPIAARPKQYPQGDKDPTMAHVQVGKLATLFNTVTSSLNKTKPIVHSSERSSHDPIRNNPDRSGHWTREDSDRSRSPIAGREHFYEDRQSRDPIRNNSDRSGHWTREDGDRSRSPIAGRETFYEDRQSDGNVMVEREMYSGEEFDQKEAQPRKGHDVQERQSARESSYEARPHEQSDIEIVSEQGGHDRSTRRSRDWKVRGRRDPEGRPFIGGKMSRNDPRDQQGAGEEKSFRQMPAASPQDLMRGILYDAISSFVTALKTFLATAQGYTPLVILSEEEAVERLHPAEQTQALQIQLKLGLPSSLPAINAVFGLRDLDRGIMTILSGLSRQQLDDVVCSHPELLRDPISDRVLTVLRDVGVQDGIMGFLGI